MMRGYRALQAAGWTFSIVPELAVPAFATMCSLPKGSCPAGVSSVVSSVNTEVRRFGYLGRDYFLKEYFFLGWKKHLKLFRRGERLVRVARQLTEKGFLTPRVVAIGTHGGNRRVVTEAVDNALDVWQVLYPDFQQQRGEVDDTFLYALGSTVGNLHRSGFCHGDLRWRNVLTRLDPEGWKFYFIDNDRTFWFRFRIPLRYRVKNLSQILFSGLLIGWQQGDWQVFLEGYFGSSGLRGQDFDKLVLKVEKHANKRLELRQLRK